MAQTPNVIGLTVMQRLKETGEPATPENYERYYYEISGLPRPESALGEAQVGETPNNAFCAELLGVLRQMLQEVTDKTETLAKDLGEKNKDLAGNVTNLKSSRDKSEILRLLSTVVMQAGGIQNTVEASHKDLVETRRALVSMQEELAETRQLLNEDALTGALNRRGLDQTLMREIARAQRLDTKLSLAMVDLDFFKKVNDAGNFVPVIAKQATVASGETPVILRWDYSALADRDALAGNPNIEVVIPKSGSIAGIYIQAISAYAPHPNAAKLWMEFLYSDEGQNIWLKGYCHPIRYNDMQSRGVIPADLAAKLPKTDAPIAFPSIDQISAAKQLITDQWMSVVGADVK